MHFLSCYRREMDLDSKCRAADMHKANRAVFVLQCYKQGSLTPLWHQNVHICPLLFTSYGTIDFGRTVIEIFVSLCGF